MSRKIQLLFSILALIISSTGLVRVFFEYKINFDIVSILIGILGCFLGTLVSYILIKAVQRKHKSAVFLAYSLPDKEFADKFAAKLEENKIKVLNEEDYLKIGINFIDTINKELQNVDFVIILISRDSNKSQQLNKVIALSKSKSKRIIPITIDDTELPKSVAKYTAINSSSKENLDQVTHDLANRLIHAY